MKTKIILALAVLALAGCNTSTPPQVGWISQSWKDDFTDIRHVMVTTGSYYYGDGRVTTVTGGLYPFVGKRGEELLVGVRSGGRLRVPVGDVQIRIDDNPAWTITVMETPLDRPLDKDATQAAVQTVIAASTRPYTAATGEKAKQILAQMLAGKRLIYRQVTPGTQTSTTGEFAIDDSFRTELLKTGILAGNADRK
jgi:hypothetical protein